MTYRQKTRSIGMSLTKLLRDKRNFSTLARTVGGIIRHLGDNHDETSRLIASMLRDAIRCKRFRVAGQICQFLAALTEVLARNYQEDILPDALRRQIAIQAMREGIRPSRPTKPHAKTSARSTLEEQTIPARHAYSEDEWKAALYFDTATIDRGVSFSRRPPKHPLTLELSPAAAPEPEDGDE